MALLNKIGQVLTSDITKDFKFSRKNKLNGDLELTFVDQLKSAVVSINSVSGYITDCP